MSAYERPPPTDTEKSAYQYKPRYEKSRPPKCEKVGKDPNRHTGFKAKRAIVKARGPSPFSLARYANLKGKTAR